MVQYCEKCKRQAFYILKPDLALSKLALRHSPFTYIIFNEENHAVKINC